MDLDGDHDLFEVDLPDQWPGLSVAQIDIRKQYGINIIGVRHNGKIEYSVTPQTQFQTGDTILVLGRYRDLQKCFQI